MCCALQSFGANQLPIMADEPQVRKRSFRKYSYRGVDLEQLLDMKTDELVELYGARQRRRYAIALPWVIRFNHQLMGEQCWFSPSLFLSVPSRSPSLPSFPRPRFQRGLNRKCMALIKKLRKARKAVEGTSEKPDPVRTHLRNMVIIPEMIGSVIGVYNGKTFNQVEIKPDMIGHYLAEFSISYKPVGHGRPGIGATNSSRFIPLK